MDDQLLFFGVRSLHVDYLQPTPLGVDLKPSAVKLTEIKGRKTVCAVLCMQKVFMNRRRGEVVAIQIPRAWVERWREMQPHQCPLLFFCFAVC